MAMSKWVPTADPRALRRLGKLAEELGELQARVARCIIQGVNEVDPASRRANRYHLTDEIADVLAQVRLTIGAFGLDMDAIEIRTKAKLGQMAEWEGFFEPEKGGA